MNLDANGRLDHVWLWLGRRSAREVRLLNLTSIALLLFVLGGSLIWPAFREVRQERVRLRASRVSLQRLEDLLRRRDEIMARAQDLISDYLESERLDASSLILQRMERGQEASVQLNSIYPLGPTATREGNRFRAVFSGGSGNLARLFFSLDGGAPPVRLRELTLTPDRGAAEGLSATTILEVNQSVLPEDWERLFAHWSGGRGTASSAANPPTRAVANRSAVVVGTGTAADSLGPVRSWLAAREKAIVGGAGRLSRAAGGAVTNWYHKGLVLTGLKAKDPSRQVTGVRNDGERGAHGGPRSGSAPPASPPRAPSVPLFRSQSARVSPSSAASAVAGGSAPGSGEISGQPRAARFPYTHIDRPGLFRSPRSLDSAQRLGQAAPTIQTLLQNLSLVGVIWSKSPVAILTDKTAAQTYYAKAGEFVGELEVVEIGKSSIILKYKEEEGRLE